MRALGTDHLHVVSPSQVAQERCYVLLNGEVYMRFANDENHGLAGAAVKALLDSPQRGGQEHITCGPLEPLQRLLRATGEEELKGEHHQHYNLRKSQDFHL